MASSTKRAATSLTRPEPLVITTNWMMIRIRKTTIPTARSLPPTYSPKAVITWPASPPVRISRVDATFRPSRNMVVKSSRVGKVERSVARWAFRTTISSRIEPVRFVASSRSRAIGGSGDSRVARRPSRPSPRSQSE